MSRMRWNTYDSRGPAWRRARTRGVAAVALLGLCSFGAVTGSASVSRADTAPATADLDVLSQRQSAEQGALRQAYQVRKADVERAATARLSALDLDLATDRAALDDAAALARAARAAERAAALSAVTTSRLPAVERLRLQAVTDRSAVDLFFRDVLAGLGPDLVVPSRTALDTAKKKIEARRGAELAALGAAHAAESAALDQRVRAAVTELDAQTARLDEDRRQRQETLDAALTTTRTALSGSLAELLRQVDAETAAVRARHAQERLDLDRLHSSQKTAAATASSAVRSALDDRQHREDDQLKAAHANELAAQDAARKDAQDDEELARHAAEDQRALDGRDLDAATGAAKAAVAAEKSATTATGSAEVRRLDDDHAVRYAAVKATYDAAAAGIAKAQPGVRAAWSDRVAKLATEQARATAALDAALEVQRKEVASTYAGRDAAAARALAQDRAARERQDRRDRAQAQWQTEKELGEAQRDLDRRLRLLASEYFTLRLRAVAFLEQPGGYTSVDAAYDPSTDPGSLYNVARRIGASDVAATGEGVDVALVDTGVVDVPGLAEADVEVGPDFSFEEVVPELRGRDTMGHGTHLGGIIAARDAAWLAGDHQRRPERVLGVAPGARLLSVKAGAADGAVDVSQVIAAVNWVTANAHTGGRNVRVLNLSFGTDGVQDYRLDPLARAVERAWQAGIVVVVAGGNDGWASSRLTNPAQDPFVLAVGSSQTVDGKESVPSAYSEGSAQGRTVDLAAPGRSVVSLRNEGSSSDDRNLAGRVGGRLVRGSGTSQAAAVTSGAVAVLLSARPELTPDQVKHVLRTTAERPAAGDTALAGAGYLRVDRAVKSPVPWVVQGFERSTGAGTLDGARGSVRVIRDGIVLEGEYDVFGRDWSGARWTEDSWSGARWTGARWTGADPATRWTGARWTTDMWSGTSWSGARWTTDLWTGARWTGARWTTDGFTGARWTGARWTAGGWYGAGWDDGPSSVATTGEEPVTPAAEALATAG